MLIYSYAYDYDIRLFTILYPFDTPRAKPGPTQLKLFMTWGADRRCLILGVLELFGKSGLGWKIPPPTCSQLIIAIYQSETWVAPFFFAKILGQQRQFIFLSPAIFAASSPQVPKLPSCQGISTGTVRLGAVKMGRFLGAPGARSP